MKFLSLRPSPLSLTDVAVARKHFESTKSLMMALAGQLNDMPDTAISLELAVKDGQLRYVIGIDESFQQTVIQQLYAAFPSSEVAHLDNWQVFDQPGQMAGLSVQFSPDDAEIRSDEFTSADPLQPLLEVLSSISNPSRALFQVLLTPADTKHSLSARAVIAVHDGMIGLLQSSVGVHTESKESEDNLKLKSANMRINIRIITLATSQDEASTQANRIASALHSLAIPGQTKLRLQSPKQLDNWLKSTLTRQPDRATSFLITAPEAANLFHTPMSPRAYPSLQTLASTHLPLPAEVNTKGVLMGFGSYRGQRVPVRMSPADRLRHTYLIGQTGTGKSTLFQSAILQDMQAGDGCCFIDPHGEAIDWLLPRIPKHRAGDVILFDPSDPEAILGLNLLEWRTPHERDLLIQELILLFYKLFDPEHTGIIGPQFEHWLRNAALTITEPKVRGTIVDIPRLFTDRAFQQAVVARTDNWAAKDFWQNQMAQTADFHKSEMLNYFTSKFGSFLGNDVMRRILSQRVSAFDVRELMDRRKILLVNLSKGKLGSLNSQLLGALIVTKIQMAAMSRANVPAEQRAPFYVYIDEFQNVVTDSFAQMLSEIRKYGVGLHLAHQYVDQLPLSIKQAIVGNVGTLMAFRLGSTDAAWLAPHFAPLAADDLTAIEPYHYHIRTLTNGQLTTPFTVRSPMVHIQPQPALEAALRNHVRQFVSISNGKRTAIPTA